MINSLSYDIARCPATEKHCPEKFHCLRFTAPGRPEGGQYSIDYSAQLKLGKACIFMMRADIKTKETLNWVD